MTTEKLRPGMLVLYVFGPITLGPHTLTRRIPALEKKFPAKYEGEYWLGVVGEQQQFGSASLGL